MVTVRPAPGVTREWLQRAVSDHMSRTAAGAPMADCPLAVSGATADVSSTGDGFAVTIPAAIGRDRDLEHYEILQRANALVVR